MFKYLIPLFFITMTPHAYSSSETCNDFIIDNFEKGYQFNIDDINLSYEDTVDLVMGFTYNTTVSDTIIKSGIYRNKQLVGFVQYFKKKSDLAKNLQVLKNNDYVYNWIGICRRDNKMNSHVYKIYKKGAIK